jgi:hypothetical protein
MTPPPDEDGHHAPIATPDGATPDPAPESPVAGNVGPISNQRIP